jgi:hypothetical protein
MASPPSGQSCANCNFYIGGTCHEDSARAGAPGTPRWATVDSGEWCAFWNVWPGRAGISGGAIGSGQAAPTGGADGDYYVKYTVLNIYWVTDVKIYQRQLGNWVVIQQAFP